MAWEHIHNGKQWLTPNAIDPKSKLPLGNSLKQLEQTSTFSGKNNITKCTSSNQCASGYACVGGVCEQHLPSNPNGSVAGCGDINAQPIEQRCCVKSSSQDIKACTSPGCSSERCSPITDCKGNVVCRYSSGKIVCECCGKNDNRPGSRPGGGGGSGGGGGTGASCDPFCDNFWKTIALPNLDSCANKTCSECGVCGDGNLCEPTNCGQGPCWCDKSCIPPCQYCAVNGEIYNDTQNCGYCYTVYKECSCGEFKRTCCYSISDINGLSPGQHGVGKGVLSCQNEIDCSKSCPDDTTATTSDSTNPCAPRISSGSTCFNTTSSCASLGNYLQDGNGYDYTQTGCISSGTEACILYNVSNYNNLPDNCYECNCNETEECVTASNGLTKTCIPRRVRYGINFTLSPPNIVCGSCSSSSRTSYDFPGYTSDATTCCVCNGFPFCGGCHHNEGCYTYNYYSSNGTVDFLDRVRTATVVTMQYQVASIPYEIWRNVDSFTPYMIFGPT